MVAVWVARFWFLVGLGGQCVRIYSHTDGLGAVIGWFVGPGSRCVRIRSHVGGLDGRGWLILQCRRSLCED